MDENEWTVRRWLLWGLPYLTRPRDKRTLQKVRKALETGRSAPSIALISVWWAVHEADPKYWPPGSVDRLTDWLRGVALGHLVHLDTVIPLAMILAQEEEAA